jgi:4-aminobutyrate aminotransferase / (S)-3-amino-2-methylpropionate transaminase / 5-aminovalerate transaminase
MPLSETPPPLSSDAGGAPPMIRVRPPGPMSIGWAARLERSESPAFGARRQARADVAGAEMAPIVYASGSGSNVTDVDGNRYVDLAAGFGALLLGHDPPRVRRALQLQVDRLWMALGDLYPSDAKIALTERLAELYPAKGARVILGKSGSDAVSAALKTAKLVTGKPGIVAFEGSYHGLDYGPLAACGLRKSWREAFADQLNAHVAFAPYPRAARDVDQSLSRVKSALDAGDVGAVLVEPILGRGGCVVPPADFLTELRGLTRREGALLIADEIWTGLGRAGHLLSMIAAGVLPDMVCLGKGLGGGLPISACIGADEIMQSWRREPSQEVVHTATFHGAPLACATAIAMLDALRSENLEVRVREVGERWKQSLASSLAEVPGAGEVRGSGLMLGIAVGSGATALALQRALLEAGYVVTIGGLASEVLIVTPALTIAESLLEGFTSTLRGLLEGPRSA